VLSPERIVGLESQVAELKAQVDALTKMLFGKKSEKSKKSKEQSPEPPESGLYQKYLHIFYPSWQAFFEGDFEFFDFFDVEDHLG
jgi:hypothetical protein